MILPGKPLNAPATVIVLHYWVVDGFHLQSSSQSQSTVNNIDVEYDVDNQRLHRQHLPAVQAFFPALPMEDSGPNDVATTIGRHENNKSLTNKTFSRAFTLATILTSLGQFCHSKLHLLPLIFGIPNITSNATGPLFN